MPDFFLFRSGSHDFALPVGDVLGVGQVSATVALPYAPSYVEGVTGAFDRVVPQLSLLARLGLTDDARDERALILVDDGVGGTALRVDAVERIVSSRVAPRVAPGQTEDDVICGGDLTIGRRTFRLIKPRALRFDAEPVVSLDVDEPTWRDRQTPVSAVAEQSAPMVVFTCGARRFAVPGSHVERLAVMPSVIHPVSAPKPVLGRSRDDGSLVVSLASALKIADAETPQIVLVVSAGSREIAFTVDDTTGIQTCRVDNDGDKVVLTLPCGGSVEQLDLKTLADRYTQPGDGNRAPALPLAKRSDAQVAGRTRLLTVRVNESWYGLSADLVRSVGVPSGYARLHGAGRRFDGVAVMAGDAVPAIDLHRVFQAPRRSSGVATVMATRDGTVALMCDAVGRIEEIQTDRVESTGEPFIAGRISRSTQTIHMIDLRSVVQQELAA